MPISFEKLFSLMKKQGIKKIDLREKYNINSRTVARLSKNEGVNTATIEQLCEILKCQPGDIMQYINNKK